MRAAWVLALLLLPGAAAGPMLVAVAPDLPGDLEAVAVGSDAAWSTDGWALRDGEGTVRLPSARLGAHEPLWLASDLSSWRSHVGATPAHAWNATGPFRLADAGETLELVAPDGRAADAFSWGDDDGAGFALRHTSGNLVYTRDVGWPDTDAAADWVTPRLHRLGESRLDRPAFLVDRITLYASPDSSHEVLAGLIAEARERLHLHVYELGSLDLAERLSQARRDNPALDLQVLVDGSPVGMTSLERHRTTQALARIQDAGGAAFLSGKGRYSYHHLKVLVADDDVAVQSENWVDSGVPRDPSRGNRGWGAVLHDAEAADWFASWLAADRAAWDTKPFDAATFDPLSEPVAQGAPRRGEYGPVIGPLTLEGPIRVTPLVSPEHTQDPRIDPVAALVKSATKTIDVQQLDLSERAANRLGWSSPDPLLDSLVGAAGRGVRVRVLAASPFSAEDDGNGAELQRLAAHGVEASTMARPGILTLHNKALVVDGAIVVVGSMNGNHHSRSANREAGLVIESAAAAAYFTRLFEGDWTGERAPPDPMVIARDVKGMPGAPLPSLLAVAAVVAALRVRRA